MSLAAIYQHTEPESSSTKTRALCELAVCYLLVLVTLWTAGETQRIFLLLTAAWIVVTTVLLRNKEKLLGLRPSGLRRSWWIIVAAVVLALASMALSAQLGTLHIGFDTRRPAWHSGVYALWALGQQFILQDYFLLRIRRLVPSDAVAIGIAAAIFAVAHVPNPVLMIATLVWAVAACWLFLRYRDLYALGAAHAIFGLCIAFTIPNAVHHQMRVGLGYLTYRAPVRAHSAQPEQPDGVHARVRDR